MYIGPVTVLNIISSTHFASFAIFQFRPIAAVSPYLPRFQMSTVNLKYIPRHVFGQQLAVVASYTPHECLDGSLGDFQDAQVCGPGVRLTFDLPPHPNNFGCDEATKSNVIKSRCPGIPR